MAEDSSHTTDTYKRRLSFAPESAWPRSLRCRAIIFAMTNSTLEGGRRADP
jgi:hypothetical protein